MESKKRLYVSGFLISISIVWIFILAIDWSRLFFYFNPSDAAENPLSKSLKLLLSFSVAIFVVWSTINNYYVNYKDRIFLPLTFLLFFIAEIFFYFKNPNIGIGIFSFAQLLFTFRNSSGLKCFLKNKKNYKKIPKILFIIFVVLLVSIIILWKILLPNSSNPLFVVMIAYSVFLSISTIIGLLTPIIGYFTYVNSVLIALGSILFYSGDVTVGLNLILPLGIPYIISSSLTWIFYLPSIVLLALSGYEWK